jgi:hypothetical protein
VPDWRDGVVRKRGGEREAREVFEYDTFCDVEDMYFAQGQSQLQEPRRHSPYGVQGTGTRGESYTARDLRVLDEPELVTRKRGPVVGEYSTQSDDFATEESPRNERVVAIRGPRTD